MLVVHVNPIAWGVPIFVLQPTTVTNQSPFPSTIPFTAWKGDLWNQCTTGERDSERLRLRKLRLNLSKLKYRKVVRTDPVCRKKGAKQWIRGWVRYDAS